MESVQDTRATKVSEACAALLAAANDIERATSGCGSSSHWRKLALPTTVRVKRSLLELQNFARDTFRMRKKTKQEKQSYIRRALAVIVLLGATTSLTKSAIFKMSAVGMWSQHGRAYKFSYALSLTMMVFLLKMCLGFVEFCIRDDGDEETEAACDAAPASVGGGCIVAPQASRSIEDFGRISLWEQCVPWLLLLVFTAFEMMSATVASMGLLLGTPTSIFVIFKSSKVVFLAILSVIVLGRRLNCAQWSSLLLISLAMVMAMLAEGKDSKKAGGYSLIGPALLLVSELFHATFLVLQEISVRRYWSSPLALLCASAALGAAMTAFTMHQVSKVWVTFADGSQRPMSDILDSVYMCWQNKALGLTMVLHLVAHVSSDLMHIVILQHISALARTLCDAVKLILMWGCGKLFWILGVLPFLAEAWHPGLIGSWLMLPAIIVVVWALLMFKRAAFIPLKVVKIDRKWGIEEKKAKRESSSGGGDVKVSPEDPFFVSMFRSRKIRREMLKRSSVRRRSIGAIARFKAPPGRATSSPKTAPARGECIERTDA